MREVAPPIRSLPVLTIVAGSGRADEPADDDRPEDEFLAMLGHELRNPLAAINNALVLLQNEQQQTAMQRRAQAFIDRQVGRNGAARR